MIACGYQLAYALLISGALCALAGVLVWLEDSP